MSIRDKKFGLTTKDLKELTRLCRSEDFEQNELLLQCCVDADTYKIGIALDLYNSILGLSYERASGKKYIPLNKNDFYGYRRYALSIFKEKTNGKRKRKS